MTHLQDEESRDPDIDRARREITAMADRLIARIKALGGGRPEALAAACVEEAKKWLERYPPE
jgi:hypothetical protein